MRDHGLGSRECAALCGGRAGADRLTTHASAGVLRTLGMDARARTLDGLRELALHGLQALSGARVIPDLCVPGGLRRDLAAPERETLLVTLPKLNRGLFRFIDTLIEQRALLARTIEVGVLARAAAEQFGVRGPLARAWGSRVMPDLIIRMRPTHIWPSSRSPKMAAMYMRG